MIFILVLNYNKYRDTKACVHRLLASDLPAQSQIVILDNSPSPKSSQYLKKAFPKLKIIRNPSNLGFAGGNNIGVRMALKDRATHVLIINPDVCIGRHFFRPLLKVLADTPRLGIVAPAIRHQLNEQVFYGLEGHLDWRLAKASHVNRRRLPQSKRLRFGDFVTFACVLIKSDVFKKAGLLDERYFMYLEDVDFCLTAAKAGFRSAVLPAVTVDHQTSSSFKKPTDKLKISFLSQLKFIGKWLSWPNKITAFLYTIFFYPYLYLLWSVHFWRHNHATSSS